MENLTKASETRSTFFFDQMNAMQNLMFGFTRYHAEFLIPYLISTLYFSRAEADLLKKGCWDTDVLGEFTDLMRLNIDLWGRSFCCTVQALDGFLDNEIDQYYQALSNLWSTGQGQALTTFLSRQSAMISGVSQNLPRAIQEIEPEYGFHFEQGTHPLVAQTPRFLLYRIMPSDPQAVQNENGKPVLIVPPFVLGSNILGFLPGEKKSYAHSFANQGIPTYIRIMKDISTTPAFQKMTLEEDALDTKYFCGKIMAAHGKKVTLNGYCQGGFTCLCNILSGELDHVVDAFITCVAPMDGTRSRGLGKFLESLPPRFNNLIYGTKVLANGNKVADGKLMGWVYKLKSIESESPVVAFLRDMLMVAHMEKFSGKISKTAAALNFWLQNERSDIPLAVTEMSFASYNVPVTRNGTLPVTLFGKELNIKGIEEKKIPWLLCYGENDDLVEKETALAPLDYIQVETAPFPKGHVAIATSWSHPDSDYALHHRFGPENRHRGPVRFHLDLDQDLNHRAEQATAKETDTPSKKPEEPMPPKKEVNPQKVKNNPARAKTAAKKTVKKKATPAKKSTAQKKPVKKAGEKKTPGKSRVTSKAGAAKKTAPSPSLDKGEGTKA